MDNCNKVIAILALLYTVGNQLGLSPVRPAAAQQWTGDRAAPAGGQPHELIRRPDWGRAAPLRGKQLDGRQDSDDDYASFWRDLEAQLFLAQLLNLTKLRLADPKARDSLARLNDFSGKCAQFNKSLDTAQLSLVKLLELTNLERLYQFELPRKASKDARGLEDSLAMQRTSFDKRQQAMRALSSLGNTVTLFFLCESNLMQLNQNDPLLIDMTQLEDYMRKLGLHVERAISNHDKSFAYLIPEGADMSLDSLTNNDRRQSNSLIDKLQFAIVELKTELEAGAKNLKQFLGLDDEPLPATKQT